MQTVMSRGQGNEFLNKLEKAGCFSDEVDTVILNKGNKVARTLVRVIRAAKGDPNVLEAIEKLLSSNGDKAATIRVSKYAGEVVESDMTYPQEYTGPKSIEEGVKVIAKTFGLDPADALEYAKTLPAPTRDVEGLFAMPSIPVLVAKHFPDVEDPEEQYCKVVQLIMDMLAAQRSFYNNRQGHQIVPKHLLLSARTTSAYQQIAQTQKGDIWIIQAQLGLKHRGRSIRLARDLFEGNEFGLDIVAVGSIALVHPERFVRAEELDIDLSGNEWSLRGDGVFEYSVYLYFSDGKLKFGRRPLDFQSHLFGSASGFVSVATVLPS